MDALSGRAVFSVENSVYCWDDVVLAAQLWSDWSRVRERAREGLACLARLEEEEDAVTDEEIESAADEFRYARDLVSAEDMEKWLGEWGLTAERWMDWIRGSVLRQKESGGTAGLASECAPSEEELEDFVATEAVCSGELHRLAYRLAGRAAVNQRENASRLPEAGNSAEGQAAKRENLALLEHSFTEFRRRVLTPAAIEREIRSHRSDWTRIDCQRVSFRQEEKAREAALCVREDGDDLADVAAGSGSEVQNERFALGEIEPELLSGFLGARKGDLIGPVERGEEFILYLVMDRTAPSEDDSADVQRAESALLNRLVDREINDRVRWAGPPVAAV